MTASALYTGQVTHQRMRGPGHALRYRVFMLLLDLDELDGLQTRLKLAPRRRFGLMSFWPPDYGDGSDTPLKIQVERRLAEAGIEAGGPVRLLTMPRVLGYGFNPLSLYLCHRPDGRLAAILYEVSNTFGQRHSYLIACDADVGEVVRQAADKAFHVSPFMPMDLNYQFTVRGPDAGVQVAVAVHDADGLLLSTAFVGTRGALSDATLFGAWISHPLLTAKVIAGRLAGTLGPVDAGATEMDLAAPHRLQPRDHA